MDRSFALRGVSHACAALALIAVSASGTIGSAQEKGLVPQPLSLKSTRTVQFTTDEGTWISLDLSPDGKTIVFELLGDLYTLPLAGGQAKPLTTGMAYDAQPRYSPDGKQLVFVSDRDGAENVWIANADGSGARALTKDRQKGFVSPEWTPDGKYILVSRTSDVFGGRELWMYDALGGNGVQITKASPAPKTPSKEQLNVSGAVESPDGRYIYYSKRNGLFGYDAVFPLWQIVRHDTQTGADDVITAEQGSAIRPRISPDGKWLVYGTRLNAKSGLRARDLATGAEHWLAYPIDRDEQEGIGTRDLLPGYAFTPDSAAIVVSYGGKLHRVAVVTGKADLIPFTAEVKQELGPLVHSDHRVETGPVVARITSDAKLSPDGKSVAFSALAHVYVADAATGKARRLTTGDAAEFQPVWSPDGKSVAYVTWDAEAGGAVWKVPVEGGSPVRLTDGNGFFTDLAWSLDGKEIVALRSSMEARRQRRVEYMFHGLNVVPGTDIVSVPAAGGRYEVLAPARGMLRPRFVKGSDRLYADGPKGLISMRRDGSDVRELMVVKAKDVQGANEMINATIVEPSPDGTRALALVNHSAWMIDLPLVGGMPVEFDPTKPSLAGKRVNVEGVDDLGWSPDGTQVFWTTGATLFRVPVSSVLRAENDEVEHAAKPSAEASAKADAGKKTAAPAAQTASLDVTHTYLKVEEPRAVPEGSVVLRGARVITMKGDQVVENADVVVTKDRVVAVGPQGSVKLPADAKILDVTGKTIIPGLIDVHAHWTQIRRDVLELENWPLEANLAYGVTAGRDPQTFTVDAFAYQDLADTGRVLGPRAFSTGPGIFHENDFHSLKDAEDTVRRYTEYYRTHLLKSYMVGDRQQRQWMVEASQELKAMPTTEGGIDTRLDLTQVLDGFSGNEHNYPQTPIYKDIVQLQAQARTAYTPTLVVAYGGPTATQYFLEHTEVHDDPKVKRFIDPFVLAHDSERMPWTRDDEYVFPQQAADAAKILRAGGIVGLGGHGMMQGLQVHWEMWAMVMGGMTPLEALSVGTIHSAEAIGLEKDLGSLETGKLADLVVLDRNPLTDIHNSNSVHWVMRGGMIYSGDTLDEVWPQQKTAHPRWWESPEYNPVK